MDNQCLKLFYESAQWELNPHFRHGKAIGYRYIMGAKQVSFVRQIVTRSWRSCVDKCDRKVT